jgi:hypothetical protein
MLRVLRDAQHIEGFIIPRYGGPMAICSLPFSGLLWRILLATRLQRRADSDPDAAKSPASPSFNGLEHLMPS